MNEQPGDEYGASIGSVMKARKQYEEACAAQGPASWAAEQAHAYLAREIEHRNEMRQRHDEAEARPARVTTPTSPGSDLSHGTEAKHD